MVPELTFQTEFSVKPTRIINGDFFLFGVLGCFLFKPWSVWISTKKQKGSAMPVHERKCSFPIFRGPTPLVCLGAALLLGLTSCGGGPKLYQVEGKISMGNQPIKAGSVTLYPEDPKSESKALPTGMIDNGTFKITTEGKPGAPLGKYKVTVMEGGGAGDPAAMGGAPKAAGLNKYMDSAKTDLKLEVVESPAPGAYDLKLTK